MQTSVVIIVAMESERVHLDRVMPGWELIEGTGWITRRRGDVICITCGVGMVAAAAATEHAIATYEPTALLNYGCVGSHDRDLFPGDVVIGERLVHQGRVRIAPDGSRIPLEIGFVVPGEAEKTTELACDPVLMRLAEDAAASLDLPGWPAEMRLESQPDRSPIVRIGTVSSGDVWLQNVALIDAAHARTGSLCEDMEAASIAQICAMRAIPFLTVKDVSNSEFHVATDFEGSSAGLHTPELGLRAAMIVARVIENLDLLGRTRDLRYS